jgi:hypothetical protein
LMLRKKLRSLDANTTGNVTQSAKSSEIRDSEGKEIEDMVNKYGYEVLTEYLSFPENQDLVQLLIEVSGKEHWSSTNESESEKVDKFFRTIEVFTCDKQKKIYNDLNEMYSTLKKQKIEDNDWDLDTQIEDLNAATRNKKVMYFGTDTNEFSKSVFIEDKYITPKGVPYTKDELEEEMIKLAGTKKYTEAHADILEEFDSYVKAQLEEIVIIQGEADISNAETDEEKEEIIRLHKEKVDAILDAKNTELANVKRKIVFFSPSKAIHIPSEPDLLQDGAFDEDGNLINMPSTILGRVVGIKFLSKSGKKFSPMNVEIQMASYSRVVPHYKITLTKSYANVHEWIMAKRVHPIEYEFIDAWSVGSVAERTKMRVLTGEIFTGFELAEQLTKEPEKYKDKVRLIKYTTSGGSVETGIRIWQKKEIDLSKEDSRALLPINSSTMFEYVANKTYYDYFLPSTTEFFLKNNQQNSINFCITTGIYGSRKKPDAKKQSILYTEEEINKIEEITQCSKRPAAVSLYWLIDGVTKYIRNIQIVLFQFDVNNLQPLLDYLYNSQKIIVPSPKATGENDFIVYMAEDTFVDSGESKDKEGVYNYYLLSSFNPTKVPPNYIQDSFTVVPENSNGKISTKYGLTPIECYIHKVVPADITELDAVKNILSSIKNDEDRLVFVNNVKNAGTDYMKVFSLISETLKIAPRYAIGNVSPDYAGEIVSKNIDAAFKNEEDTSKKVETTTEEKEMVSLTWETAQKFIIKLKSL